jgi:hypothetical protein
MHTAEPDGILPRAGGPVHVLHIPKTGITALRAALAPYIRSHRLIFHNHWKTLDDIPVGQRVVFSVRDPVTRFVSAFNSRLRQGRPRYDVPWSTVQRCRFERFTTPNEAAEALSSCDTDQRTAALELIEDMFHTRYPLGFWLKSPDYLSQRRDDIELVLWQEKLNDDFAVLKRALRVPDDAALPRDPVESHRTPPGFRTYLSETALRNIVQRYHSDFWLFEAALSVRRDCIVSIAAQH